VVAESDINGESGVPVEWQLAAERVRAHLCAVRGGAMFLSSADAARLMGWLAEGRPVGSIVVAIERAAAARQAARSKAPLTLGHAARHLAKAAPRAAPAPSESSAHPFAPLIEAAAGGGPAEATLRRALLGIDADDPEAELMALAALSAWYDALWSALPADERERRCEAQMDLLGGLVDLVGDEAAWALAEEAVRAELRRERPGLDAAHLWGCLEAHAARREQA
jgi:hypothetical protein